MILICFSLGQIGFAVILIFFFYYFAIILIVGAQINAHFFEKHPPFDSPLGTYLSELNGQHSNSTELLHNDNNAQPSSTTSATNQQRKTGWMNKLWPCCKRTSVQPEPLENDRV